MTIGDAALENVLNPGGGTKYDLVLDMNQQVYGASVQNDTISIVARNVNGKLQIVVAGTGKSADASLSGMYYDAPIANIRSLTIRGSNDDNETIDIEGLALDSITVEGRGGGGDTIRVRGVQADLLTMRGGDGDDLIQVDMAPSARVDIFGGGGTDIVEVGKQTLSLNGLQGVFVDGGAGDDTVRFFDQAATSGRQYALAAGSEQWPMNLTVTGTPLLASMLATEKFELFTGGHTDLVHITAALGFTNGVFVDLPNFGTNQVTVGTIGEGLAKIGSQIHIAGHSSTTLDIDDRGHVSPFPDNGGRTHTLQAGTQPYYDTSYSIVGNSVLGVHGFGIKQYSLYGGSSNDTFDIDATSPFAVLGTYIFGGGGYDTINVGSVADGLKDIGRVIDVSQLGQVYVDGGGTGLQGGKIIVRDGASTGKNLYIWGSTTTPGYDARLYRVAIAPQNPWDDKPRMIYTRLLNKYTLEAGSNDDDIRIEGTAAAVTNGYSVKGNGGNDAFRVGTSTKGLDDIHIAIELEGNGGENILIATDVAGIVGNGKYKVNKVGAGSGNIRRAGAADTAFIEFTGIQKPFGATGIIDAALQFLGRVGGSEVDLAGLATGTSFAYLGNAGIDRLVVSAEAGTAWAFDGAGGSDQLAVASGGWIDPLLISVERYEVLGGSLTLVNAPPLLDDIRVIGGTLALRPGAPMTVWTASYTQTLGGILGLDLNDQIIVTGAAPPTLGGMLGLTAPYGIYTPLGRVYTLFDNRSSSPVVGRFEGLQEGAEIFVGGTRFRISYSGADFVGDPTPNNVALTLVNDAPAAIADAFGFAEDTPFSGNVLLNDSDADGDALSSSVVSWPMHGTLSLDANGSFTYTPYSNYHGADGFTYQVSDGFGGTATAYVSLTIAPVNDAPVASGSTSFITAVNTPITIAWTSFVADADGDALTASVSTQAQHGAATIAGTSLTYTPAQAFNGTDTFVLLISDGQGGYVTVTVTVSVGASGTTVVVTETPD